MSNLHKIAGKSGFMGGKISFEGKKSSSVFLAKSSFPRNAHKKPSYVPIGVKVWGHALPLFENEYDESATQPEVEASPPEKSLRSGHKPDATILAFYNQSTRLALVAFDRSWHHRA